MAKSKTAGAGSHEKVQALSQMIKDLERQLDQLLEINEAVEKERDTERRLRTRAEQKATVGVQEAQDRADRHALEAEALKAETLELEAERSRLASENERLKRALVKERTDEEDRRRLVEQLRASREDTLAELETLEAQFDQAMKIIAEQKTAASVLQEERKVMAARLKVLQERLNELEDENTMLTSESEESRRTLQVIRRSLTEAYLKRVSE